MAGSASLILAAKHPENFVYAASLILDVGFSQPVRRTVAVAGRYHADGRRRLSLLRHVGPPNDPAWAANDPTVNAAKLVGNQTRAWVYSGNGTPAEELGGKKLDASLLETPPG
jgi:diacylglycerol O-acyltransferase/trehalose O-mycolyltransferase